MTGIFFGSSTGNTEALAKEIASKLGVAPADIHDVGNTPANKAAAYDCLLLGCSTWGLGELQDDWYDFIANLKKEDLAGRKVGFFGCGDSGSYPDTFCDALGIIRDELSSSGCVFVGGIDAAGYSSTDSRAFTGGKAVGLLVDDDDAGVGSGKMNDWIEAVKNA